MLALAQSMEGKVVVTPANISLSRFQSVSIDFNKDGINDFIFAVSAGGYDHSFYGTLVAKPLTGGKVLAGTRGAIGPYASALVQGANIGPSAHFSSSVARQRIMIERTAGFASGSTGHTSFGKWGHVANHYVGVKFLINGIAHYGWVKMSVGWNGAPTGHITAYAYETTANKKVGAGVTTGAVAADSANSRANDGTARVAGPSLGMLALGARGLDLWRRDDIDPRSAQATLPRKRA